MMTLFILSGCGKSGNHKDGKERLSPEMASLIPLPFDDESDDDISNNSNIQVAVNIIPCNLEMYDNFSRYRKEAESPSDILIDVDRGYYKDYISGKRIKTQLGADFDYSEDVDCLALSLDIINNSGYDLDISKMEITVSESRPDSIPIIFICTEETNSNTITFINDSWFDWKEFYFSYTLLKDGETFNGTYEKTEKIPYFDNKYVHNLLPALAEKGYDLKKVISKIKEFEKKYGYEKMGFGMIDYYDDEFLYFGFDEEYPYSEEIKNIFSPFGISENLYGDISGKAILYGKLSFERPKFSREFISDISLSTTGEFGAGSIEVDNFNVKLRTSGKDYKMVYPYTTVIKPGGTEFVRLNLGYIPSSWHKFHIDILNNNGIPVRSKEITLHNYMPKSFATFQEII